MTLDQIKLRVKIQSLLDNPDDPDNDISGQTYIDDVEFLLDIIENLQNELEVKS
jgi:hypothetical protein